MCLATMRSSGAPTILKARRQTLRRRGQRPRRMSTARGSHREGCRRARARRRRRSGESRATGVELGRPRRGLWVMCAMSGAWAHGKGCVCGLELCVEGLSLVVLTPWRRAGLSRGFGGGVLRHGGCAAVGSLSRRRHGWEAGGWCRGEWMEPGVAKTGVSAMDEKRGMARVHLKKRREKWWDYFGIWWEIILGRIWF